MLMIVIHELGHYIAAKILKIKVVEFSIGLGPKLWQKKRKNGELISLRLLPFGGYCAFESEDEDGNETEKSFNKEKPWKRIIVLLGGAGLNMASAVLFSFIFLLAVGTVSPNSIRVAQVFTDPNGVPYNTLEQGDVITAVNGNPINIERRIADIALGTQDGYGVLQAGDTVNFSVTRGREELTIAITNTWIVQESYIGFGFTYRHEGDSGARVGWVAQHAGGFGAFSPLLGFTTVNQTTPFDFIVSINGTDIDGSNSPTSVVNYLNISQGQMVNFRVRRHNGVADTVGEYHDFTIPFMRVTPAYLGFGFGTEAVMQRSIVTALAQMFPFTGRMAWAILGSFGNLFTGATPIYEMTGPIGTVTQMAQIAQMDWANIFILFPLLAANLAIFNLLPIPALDGSKVIFTLIEWIRKKPISRKVENMIHIIGFFALIAFAVIIDIVGFFIRAGPAIGWIRI